jgi:hypothetical protein
VGTVAECLGFKHISFSVEDLHQTNLVIRDDDVETIRDLAESNYVWVRFQGGQEEWSKEKILFFLYGDQIFDREIAVRSSHVHFGCDPRNIVHAYYAGPEYEESEEEPFLLDNARPRPVPLLGTLPNLLRKVFG